MYTTATVHKFSHNQEAISKI